MVPRVSAVAGIQLSRFSIAHTIDITPEVCIIYLGNGFDMRCYRQEAI